jgi:hypothetical protein
MLLIRFAKKAYLSGMTRAAADAAVRLVAARSTCHHMATGTMQERLVVSRRRWPLSAHDSYCGLPRLHEVRYAERQWLMLVSSSPTCPTDVATAIVVPSPPILPASQELQSAPFAAVPQCDNCVDGSAAERWGGAE